ncbi:uncharacterized protein LOC123298371 isoform X2 [Chrysoperla carnea]|uniref:uncharacterized protein LOC123298371 isoform X2 n=1 Tax=Chrysoperla carnea TaxID=189513 RepID=UPI001D06DF20|nr:uncharacterized protein LOC123298371 isoform X2 [Chrysoperla carnea]
MTVDKKCCLLLQDFEIAGSQTGGAGALDSPLGTVHSWDSHANYRLRLDASPPVPLFSGVIVYCDHTHLLTSIGFIRLLLVVTSIACLGCLCSSGTVQVGLFMLPLAGRIRLMMFITIFSLLITSLLLFLDISHTIYLFPFNWGKLNAYLYVGIGLMYFISSTLIFHMVFLSDAFSWVPRWTKEHLLITGCLGFICCLESVIMSFIHKYQCRTYDPVVEDPPFTLQERANSPTNNTADNAQSPLVIYCPPAIPSTSRQNPSWTLDDVQPCSSRCTNPHRLA